MLVLLSFGANTLVELGREAWRIRERERAVRADIEAVRAANIAAAQEADQYATHRMAAAAAAKAKRLWPDVIGDVLADEIMALLDLPSWLRSQTRTRRLIDAILRMPEGPAQAGDDDRLRAGTHVGAMPNAGASRAA